MRTVLGLSGGVDSSAAARLFLVAVHEVIGAHLDVGLSALFKAKKPASLRYNPKARHIDDLPGFNSQCSIRKCGQAIACPHFFI
ncbi:MAG: hypothetical protein K6F67_00435 [Oscillospiraceae bacterium]|nr:hypothetical protein [Oscillospiraceae bacterium]